LQKQLDICPPIDLVRDLGILDSRTWPDTFQFDFHQHVGHLERLLEELNMNEHFDNVFRDWQDLLEKIYRESTFLCAAKRDKMDPSKFWQVVMIQYSGQFNTGLSEEFQNFIYAVLSIPFSSAAVESGFSYLTHLRGKERYSLLPDTSEGILIVKLNGQKIMYFRPQRYSRIYLLQGHLRCDDLSVSGQPRKRAKTVESISLAVVNDAMETCSAADETVSVIGDEFRFSEELLGEVEDEQVANMVDSGLGATLAPEIVHTDIVPDESDEDVVFIRPGANPPRTPLCLSCPVPTMVPPVPLCLTCFPPLGSNAEFPQSAVGSDHTSNDDNSAGEGTSSGPLSAAEKTYLGVKRRFTECLQANINENLKNKVPRNDPSDNDDTEE